jgi:RecJ-like exonuclease
MGLFDKKYCSICGEKIGLLGNRKLEDGNLCKNCAAKLSPWFSERRSSTVEQIRQQLEYREANKAKVAAFHVTRTLGDRVKVLFDEDARKFMVTSASSLQNANPDVMDFSDVTGCSFKIDEDKEEIMRALPDGKKESYMPKRYEYDYDFYVTINVNNPYFNEIEFQLNDGSVDDKNSPEYRSYEDMCNEIKEVLLQMRRDVRDSVESQKKSVVCPFCGATTTPTANGTCEFCGGALN